MKTIQFRAAFLIAGLMIGGEATAQNAPDAANSPRPAAQAPAAPAAKAGSAQAEAGEPRASTSAAAAVPADKDGKPKGAKRARNGAGRGAADRVDLDTTTVTGNRELPKVMYVVPWKRSDIGDLIGRPANSLLDEVLAPIDRNVFRREVQYYQALKPDSAASAPEGEK
jgi:hypothetical protein